MNAEKVLLIADTINRLASISVPLGKVVITEEQMDAYQYMLKDVPDDSIRDAAHWHMSKDETGWMPTPGEFRGLCRQVTKVTPPTYCEEGIKLGKAISGADGYWKRLIAHEKHVDECPICDEPEQKRLPRIPQEIVDVAKRLT